MYDIRKQSWKYIQKIESSAKYNLDTTAVDDCINTSIASKVNMIVLAV